MIGIIEVDMSPYGAFIKSAGYGCTHVKVNDPEEIGKAVQKFIEKCERKEKK